MRTCPKCGSDVPKKCIIGGKKINCQHRKYCFECSPFGAHNTRKIEEKITDGHVAKICAFCGNHHNQKGRRCPTCNFNYRKINVTAKVQSIVGKKCWICSYDKCWRNLAFHHIDPSKKLFCLTSREYMLKWEKVYAEMKKCVLLCHNCHGEVHESLISKERILELHKNFWNQLS